ncbi:BhlA/UviB family holin-like peptide [Longirhabdus pacifica]|uniref:BhlA/UviB family holin-like peptide n=1 Tax=Longirhabdus pacifica TaxID=2305227 RepID=UPI00100880CF|nr:BhlA/UviB family holin-like peptide [Longirhabdus pacifica]
MDISNDFIDFFSIYGPFAVLFVSLFYWTLRTHTQREEVYRKEIASMRKEHEERSKRYYTLLNKFAEKYDIIIDKILDIEQKLDGRE